jgi:hypothetical protein
MAAGEEKDTGPGARNLNQMSREAFQTGASMSRENPIKNTAECAVFQFETLGLPRTLIDRGSSGKIGRRYTFR